MFSFYEERSLAIIYTFIVLMPVKLVHIFTYFDHRSMFSPLFTFALFGAPTPNTQENHTQRDLLLLTNA